MLTTTAQNDLLDVPLYNSRIIDNYVKLLRKRYANIDIGELLKYAGMTSYEVEDQGHWFSQRQINRFHEKLAARTGNPNIAREAGRYASSPDAIGFMRPYVLGMVDPESAFRMVNRTAQKLTRSTRYQSRKIAPNKVEIVGTPVKGAKEQPFQCENRMGLFESVTLILSSKLPLIQHPECMFRGDDRCRYIISWESSFSDVWKKLRWPLAAVVPALAAMLAWTYPQIRLLEALLSGAAVYLLTSVICGYVEQGELKTSIHHLMDSTETLLDQVNVNYNRSILTNEIGRAINTLTSIKDILHNVTLILENRLDFDRGLILLANAQRTRLEIRAGFGYSEENQEQIRRTFFRLDNPNSKGIFVVAFKKQKAYLVNDIGQIQDDLSPKSFEFAKKMGACAFICCPIVCDGESIGIVAVDNLKSKQPLVQSDLVLLKGIASVLGVSLKNAQLIEAKNRQFTSLIKVLGASIDARDPLTSGHSEKVTEYAMGICDELQVGKDDREAIRVAALLHDYGKIGVPDAVLKKPGRLTQSEINTIQKHAVKTREILEEINFEGIYEKVPTIAGAHHEKFDGTGYPQGLKGEEISLGARIIAVADFFEAITAKRHYREPMDYREALATLKTLSGTHFDSTVVAAFVAHYRKVHPERFLPEPMSA